MTRLTGRGSGPSATGVPQVGQSRAVHTGARWWYGGWQVAMLPIRLRRWVTSVVLVGVPASDGLDDRDRVFGGLRTRS